MDSGLCGRLSTFGVIDIQPVYPIVFYLQLYINQQNAVRIVTNWKSPKPPADKSWETDLMSFLKLEKDKILT